MREHINCVKNACAKIVMDWMVEADKYFPE